jgi:hypothetical protein
MWLSVWHPALFLAKEDVQLEVGGNQQLIEKGPGDVIRLCNLGHFAVDALMEPSQLDNLDTGVGISIGASGKLHGVASGCGLRVMHHNDSRIESSYHHQRLC